MKTKRIFHFALSLYVALALTACATRAAVRTAVTADENGNIVAPTNLLLTSSVAATSGSLAQVSGSLAALAVGTSAALDGKLDRSDAPGNYIRAYTINKDGSNALMTIAQSVAGNSLVQRTGGNIQVPDTPTLENAAASKYYVDSVSGSMTPRLLPSGGTTGQFLVRNSDAANDFAWLTPEFSGSTEVVGDYDDLLNRPEINGVPLAGQHDGNYYGLLNLASGSTQRISGNIALSNGTELLFNDGSVDEALIGYHNYGTWQAVEVGAEEKGLTLNTYDRQDGVVNAHILVNYKSAANPSGTARLLAYLDEIPTPVSGFPINGAGASITNNVTNQLIINGDNIWRINRGISGDYLQMDGNGLLLYKGGVGGLLFNVSGTRLVTSSNTFAYLSDISAAGVIISPPATETIDYNPVLSQPGTNGLTRSRLTHTETYGIDGESQIRIAAESTDADSLTLSSKTTLHVQAQQGTLVLEGDTTEIITSGPVGLTVQNVYGDPSPIAIGPGTDDNHAVTKAQLDTKQNLLTAGPGITLAGGTISATGGGGGFPLNGAGVSIVNGSYGYMTLYGGDDIALLSLRPNGVTLHHNDYEFAIAGGVASFYDIQGDGPMLISGVKAGASALDAVNKSQLDTKQDILTIDLTVDSSSDNPVSGGAVWLAIDVVDTRVVELENVVRDQNSYEVIRKWYGTQAEYEAISFKDAQTEYNIFED
jgi:hypothetical protein